eukprot:Phypoly_transcript_15483.p1 GENE.Phypoly_transcript_15483~~Phypoly_transcript_15483.p1  ORF type:complete len:171 (+),score=22.67 Phypoly_transcript_15483:120-632(+)
MDSETFKAVQAPLKEKYKENPSSAILTLTAEGDLGNQGISCSVKTGKQIAAAGLHPATGGDGTMLCSGDMLLEALVACSGVTLSAVATSLAIPIKSGHITAFGDLDFKGTLGVSKESPVGFKEIRLRFDLDTTATDEQIALLKKLTDRYCVVLQSLKGPVLSEFHKIVAQ